MKKFFSTFSSGDHFIQPSRTSLAILLNGHMRHISVKFFLILVSGLGDVA